MPGSVNRRGPPRRPPPARSLSRASVRHACHVGLLVGCGIAVLSGCRILAGEDADGITPFRGSGRSLHDVGARALEGLVSGDRASLAALRLSREEYTEVVWPELPVSDPELNVPIEYVWADIESRDRRAVNRLSPQFEGLAAEVVDVECVGGVQEFATFRVHTDCWVTIAAAPGHRRIQLFKDVLERGAGYKLFRYYDDMLRPVEKDRADGD